MNMPKHIDRREALKNVGITGTAAITGLAGCVGSQASTYEVSFAFSANEGNPLTQAARRLAKVAKEKSNGRLKITTYCCGKVESEATVPKALRSGTMDMGLVATNNMAGFTDAFKFGDLPYIWDPKNYAAQRKIWNGEIGMQQSKKAGEDAGVRILGHFMQGGDYRWLATKETKVKVPADTKGIKVRTTATELERAALESYGMTPTRVPWSETYQQIEQGIITATHNQPAWLMAANFHEVCNYMCRIRDMDNMQVLLIAPKVWKKLPSDLQGVMEEAVKEARALNFELDKKVGEEATKKFKDAGVEIYTPTDSEMEQWQNRGFDTWKDHVGSDGIPKDLVRQVLNAQDYNPPVDLVNL
jgi:TRAP-type C4-dicarboxylate transport system substrate-binding protein